MPAFLTHQAIMMLTRDRLRHLQGRMKVVRDRKLMHGTPRTAVEDKVYRLTELAIKALEEPSGADEVIRTFSGNRDPVGVSPISRFAVMGSMGPDMAGFSEAFKPGQAWVFDTIHKGTPDYNRERVNAGTTDFALNIYAEAVRRAQTGITSDTDRAKHLNRVRAYVMGHMCHLAGDIVSHPFVNDLEWHEGTGATPYRPHSDHEKALDSGVAQTMFGYGGIRSRGGGNWQRWWPGEDELDATFWEAMAGAFGTTYGPTIHPGFADFDELQRDLSPPAMDGGFFRHGYRTQRGLGLGVGYDWPWGNWFGIMAPLALPLMAAPFVAWGMPGARTFFETAPDQDNPASERAAFELILTPMAMAAPGTLVLGALLLPFAARGAGGRAITGVVMQALSIAGFVGAAVESALVERPEDGLPAWARWLGLAVPHLVSGVVFGSLGLADAFSGFRHPRPFSEKPKERRALLGFLNLVPLGILALFGVLIAIFAIIKAAAGGNRSEIRMGSAGFILPAILWVVVILILWIWAPFRLQKTQVPDIAPASDTVFGKHALRMFDDGTLWQDPSTTDARFKRVYPSDLRPLARLWWTGAGEMQIRVDRIALTFKPEGGSEQQIPAPMAPMTAAEFLTFLTDTVVDKDGGKGLAGTVHDAGDSGAAYPLPAGASFAAHGDAHPDADAIAAGLAEFRTLGTAPADDAYTLYHAAKPAQSVLVGLTATFRAGTAPALATGETADGFTYVVNPAVDPPRPDKLMGRAAELGAILCMAAAGHVGDGATPADQVWQVFRNWSLDRRRINEWRMLVTGGAFPEKPDGPDRWDPSMSASGLGPADPAAWRAPMAAPGFAAPAEEADRTLRELGWFNALEAWIAALEAGQDTTSGATADPTARPPRALGRAMALLFDAPDPAGGAA